MIFANRIRHFLYTFLILRVLISFMSLSLKILNLIKIPIQISFKSRFITAGFFPELKSNKMTLSFFFLSILANINDNIDQKV